MVSVFTIWVKVFRTSELFSEEQHFFFLQGKTSFGWIHLTPLIQFKNSYELGQKQCSLLHLYLGNRDHWKNLRNKHLQKPDLQQDLNYTHYKPHTWISIRTFTHNLKSTANGKVYCISGCSPYNNDAVCTTFMHMTNSTQCGQHVHLKHLVHNWIYILCIKDFLYGCTDLYKVLLIAESE